MLRSPSRRSSPPTYTQSNLQAADGAYDKATSLVSAAHVRACTAQRSIGDARAEPCADERDVERGVPAVSHTSKLQASTWNCQSRGASPLHRGECQSRLLSSEVNEQTHVAIIALTGAACVKQNVNAVKHVNYVKQRCALCAAPFPTYTESNPIIPPPRPAMHTDFQTLATCVLTTDYPPSQTLHTI